MDSDSRNRGTAFEQIASYIWLLQAIEDGVSSMKDLETDWLRHEELNHLSGQHREVRHRGSNIVEIEKVFNRKSVYTMMRKLKETLGVKIFKDPETGKYKYEQEEMSLEKKPLLNQLRQLLLQSRYSQYDTTEVKLVEAGKLLDSNIEQKNEEYYAAVKAVEAKKFFSFDYIHMGESTPISYRIRPYGIRCYNKSWYLWGLVEDEDPAREGHVLRGRCYSFLLKKSRMVKVCDPSDEKSFQSESDASANFSDYYGVITCDRNGLIQPVDVTLKVYTKYRKQLYYNETPIHCSQKGPLIPFPDKPLDDEDNYYLYTYHVAPTYDFIQKLLSDREDVEVIQPGWLREEMKKTIKAMLERYD